MNASDIELVRIGPLFIMFVFVLDCEYFYDWSGIAEDVWRLCGSFHGKISSLWDTELNLTLDLLHLALTFFFVRVVWVNSLPI